MLIFIYLFLIVSKATNDTYHYIPPKIEKRIQTSYEVGGYPVFIYRNMSNIKDFLQFFQTDDIINAFVIYLFIFD